MPATASPGFGVTHPMVRGTAPCYNFCLGLAQVPEIEDLHLCIGILKQGVTG